MRSGFRASAKRTRSSTVAWPEACRTVSGIRCRSEESAEVDHPLILQIAWPHRPDRLCAVEAPGALEVANHRGAEAEDQARGLLGQLLWVDAIAVDQMNALELAGAEDLHPLCLGHEEPDAVRAGLGIFGLPVPSVTAAP